MTVFALGRGDQTYVYTRSGGGFDDTITDFQAIHYNAELEVGVGQEVSIEFYLNKPRNRLLFEANATGVDFAGDTPTTADDVTGFHIHRNLLGLSATYDPNSPIAFGILGPSSDLNGDLAINGPGHSLFSAWDAQEGFNTTLLAERTNLDDGALWAVIHLNNSTTPSMFGRIFKQDNGGDRIDVSAVNISTFDTISYLLQSLPGANPQSVGILETFLNGVSYRITMRDTIVNGYHASDFVFSNAVVDETIGGSNSRDDLFGGGGNDTLSGLAGFDRLFGESGNDVLDGGGGADVMSGGSGNDTFYVDTVGETILEDGGIDTVISTISYTLNPEVENLTLAGALNLQGLGNNSANTINGNSGNNSLRGFDGNDTINGGAGADSLWGDQANDILNGGAGADIMRGGAGNDLYYFDDYADQMIEDANAGTDLIRTLLSITSLSANIENVQLNGVANFLVVGNTLNNTITGNSGNNQLRGAAGADILIGNDGNDVIIGQAGRDFMYGNNGSDVFHFDALSDMGNTVSTRDVIADFLAGTDDLDFNTMDANTVLAGNQNFTFLGTGAFTGAGQLRFIQIDATGTANDKTIVQGNLDGNLSTVEFEIELRGLQALTAGDFVL